ncbi:MAG: hypothetical protein AB1601_01405 [Planctomycetota bacterium]
MTVDQTRDPPRRRDARRSARRWVTSRLTGLAVRVAPRLRPAGAEWVGRVVARLGPRMPIVARVVADNMRAASVFTPAGHRGYFEQLGQHFAGALHALAGRPDDLARIARDQVDLDESIRRLREVIAPDRGIILVGPHIANYLLGLTRLNQELPLTVYLRHSADTTRQVAKERWYRASGVQWIAEPRDAARPLARLSAMGAAVQAGRVLFITPDLPQKRDVGTPVRFFEREVYLPAGPAALAARTGAPLFFLMAQRTPMGQRLAVRGPFVAPGMGREGRREVVAAGVQWFAAALERFLVEQTPLWYLWGDKRWTRVFRGDPRYVGPTATPHRGATCPAPACSGVT